MTTTLIRSAKIEDLNTLLAFEQDIIKVETPLDPLLKRGKIQYYNIPKMIASKDVQLLVAISEDKIIGSGYVRIENASHYHKNKQYGYIGFMYVSPSYRGQKISSLILNSLKDWVKERNLNELRLDVYSSNVSAIKSYERFGFNKGLVNMKVEI